jgi:hypothetical protein
VSAPKFAAILSQVAVAAIVAFAFGKDLANGIRVDFRDFAAPLLACSLFCALWTFDLMSVGSMRKKHKIWDSYHRLDRSKTPDDVLWAERLATNHAEQQPWFFLSVFAAAVLLNPNVAGALGLLWVLLRTLYSATMRGDGKFTDKGVGKFTIPCYFCLSTMLMGATINVLRQF